jgi:hypothetical protein
LVVGTDVGVCVVGCRQSYVVPTQWHTLIFRTLLRHLTRDCQILILYMLRIGFVLLPRRQRRL